jgi:hypothetical protein
MFTLSRTPTIIVWESAGIRVTYWVIADPCVPPETSLASKQRTLIAYPHALAKATRTTIVILHAVGIQRAMMPPKNRESKKFPGKHNYTAQSITGLSLCTRGRPFFLPPRFGARYDYLH